MSEEGYYTLISNLCEMLEEHGFNYHEMEEDDILKFQPFYETICKKSREFSDLQSKIDNDNVNEFLNKFDDKSLKHLRNCNIGKDVDGSCNCGLYTNLETYWKNRALDAEAFEEAKKKELEYQKSENIKLIGILQEVMDEFKDLDSIAGLIVDNHVWNLVLMAINGKEGRGE